MYFPGIDLNSKVTVSPENANTPVSPSSPALPLRADTVFLVFWGKTTWELKTWRGNVQPARHDSGVGLSPLCQPYVPLP